MRHQLRCWRQNSIESTLATPLQPLAIFHRHATIWGAVNWGPKLQDRYRTLVKQRKGAHYSPLFVTDVKLNYCGSLTTNTFKKETFLQLAFHEAPR